MSDRTKILDKIKFWINKLPYTSFKIEIETPDGILILQRSKASKKIKGFGQQDNKE